MCMLTTASGAARAMMSALRCISRRLSNSPLVSASAFTRVYTTLIPALSRYSPSTSATARLRSLSFTPVSLPVTPPSSPPCPASTTTVGISRRSMARDTAAGAKRAAAAASVRASAQAARLIRPPHAVFAYRFTVQHIRKSIKIRPFPPSYPQSPLRMWITLSITTVIAIFGNFRVFAQNGGLTPVFCGYHAGARRWE